MLCVSPDQILKTSTFCPKRTAVFSVDVGQTAIIYVYTLTNRLAFITETDCACCAVGTESLYTIKVNFSL